MRNSRAYCFPGVGFSLVLGFAVRKRDVLVFNHMLQNKQTCKQSYYNRQHIIHSILNAGHINFTRKLGNT